MGLMGGEKSKWWKSNRMYNVGVYYLEFPHWLQITFNNIANKTNQVPFFNCCHSQTLRKFQIINPHVIHPIASSPHLLFYPPPPHQPHQKFKKWSSPGWRILSPPANFLGGGHYVTGLTYIFFLYIYIIYFLNLVGFPLEILWRHRSMRFGSKSTIYLQELLQCPRGLKIAFALLQSKKNFITLYSDGNLPYFISF